LTSGFKSQVNKLQPKTPGHTNRSNHTNSKMETTQATQATQIESIYKQLLARKSELEQAKPITEVITETLTNQWDPVEQSRIEQFRNRLTKVKQIVKLEIAIIESIRDFVPQEMIDEISFIFPKVRITNNLQNMTGVHLKYKDNVKHRQVLKLVTAVYRYNRDLISGDSNKNTSIFKSRIKHATLCPHCGEIAKDILHNMAVTKAVMLP